MSHEPLLFSGVRWCSITRQMAQRGKFLLQNVDGSFQDPAPLDDNAIVRRPWAHLLALSARDLSLFPDVAHGADSRDEIGGVSEVM